MNDSIPLNSKVIDLYRDFLEHPEEYGCTYKPLKEVFKETDKDGKHMDWGYRLDLNI